MTEKKHLRSKDALARLLHSAGEFFGPSSECSASAIPSGLYLVSTPIGNLEDVSLRSLRILSGVDLIACEDMRVSSRLFTRYGITAKCIVYHEYNAVRQRPSLLRLLSTGQSIALISDAGTPLISDPGYHLVQDVLFSGISLHVVPGASAPLAALLLSGLPSDKFFFEGFLPSKSTSRRRRISYLRTVPSTLLFFESPHRLSASLCDLAAILGNRQAAVARELTKFHEDVNRGLLEDLAIVYSSKKIKGEIVIVVAPPISRDEPYQGDVASLIVNLLSELSFRDAVREAVELTGLPRKELYELALHCRKHKEREET